jgi:recombination protein RecA
MAKKEKDGEVAPGKIDLSAMRKLIDKKAGHKVTYDLRDDNPADVNYWIPTGSTWLDAIICRGKMGGLPGGRIIEVAGLPSTGKSYMAMQFIANGQKMGLVPVYADPEDALDSSFMERAGVDLDKVIYMQPANLESWLEAIEDLMKIHPHKFLFILDSLAATPTKSDVKGDYDPNSSVGKKARVLSLAFQKLRPMLAATDSTLVVLNQLKTNISGLADAPGGPKYATITQKYITPGGKAPEYWASLRIWLTSSSSKKQNVYDDKNYRIGSYVKARLVKSRFGTQDRFAEFKILWGDTVGVMDDESLLEAIKSSDYLQTGAWNKLLNEDGSELAKWQGLETGFVKHMNETPGFKERVMEILEEEVILKFDRREGDGNDFQDNGVGEDLQTE